MRAIFILILVSFNVDAATYYVATNGNDTTGDGSSGLPWRTISKGKTMATTAGDVVVVRPGNYGEQVNTANAGSSGNRIRFLGESYPVTEHFGVYHDWVEVSGFRFTSTTNAPYGGIQFTASNLLISSNIISDTTNTALGIVAKSAGGAFPATNAWPTNVTIRFNMVSNIAGIGMQIIAEDSLVESNEIAYIHRDAFNHWGDRTTYRGNRVHNMISNSADHMDFIQTFKGDAGWRARYVVIEGNRVWDSDAQFCNLECADDTNSWHSWTFRNNLVYNLDFQGNFGIPTNKIYNNTFYEAPNGSEGLKNAIVFFDQTGFRSYGSWISNNIIVGCGTLADPRAYALTGVGTADYNLVAGKAPGFISIASVSESNGINGQDPDFTDYSSNDFSLLSSSPAIGAGVDLSSFVTTDILGNSRTVPFDMGAYEHTGGGGGGSGSSISIRANAVRIGRIIRAP